MFGKFKKPEVPEIKYDFDSYPMTAKLDPGFSIEDYKRAMAFPDLYKEAKKKAKIEAENWIWVDGYKGVKADLTAHGGFQYEIGKEYHMDADVDVVTCASGFHLCLSLEDVFQYYVLGGGNRFFKVKALVRAKDYSEYGQHGLSPIYYRTNDKLAAKAIVLERELTLDEIFDDPQYADWTDDEKKIALADFPAVVYRNRRIAKLVEAGYSEVFARWVSDSVTRTDLALMMASQPGVSMDMKVFAIMHNQ